MADNVVLADGVQPTVTTVVTLFTSPALGNGTRVIAFTATNPTGGADTYSLFIVPSGGAAGDANTLVSLRSVAASGGTDLAPEALNHLIPKGGTLEVQVAAGTTIAFRASGINF